MLLFWVALFASGFHDSLACPGLTPHAKPLTAQQWNAFKLNRQPRKPAAGSTFLPSYDQNAPSWGGTDLNAWKPEAIIANAVSNQLNKTMPIQDVVDDEYVVVPIQILQSAYHPYGDGQSNSALALGSWPAKERRPPLQAVFIRMKTGDIRVVLNFDSTVPFKTESVEITAKFTDDTQLNVTLPTSVIDSGDRVVEWKPETFPVSMWVRPKGWNDWFPILFKHPVYPIPVLTKEAGKPLLDPEAIATDTAEGNTPFDRLIHHKFKLGYNTVPYYNQNIHGEFPLNDSPNPPKRIMGVSEGWTWLIQAPVMPFKILYTCFGRRRADLEQANGVPTSGGWHEIGIPPKRFSIRSKTPRSLWAGA